MDIDYSDASRWPHSELTQRIIGACIEVHSALGPGLLESAYQTCLALELEHRGLPFERERSIPVIYRDKQVDSAYRIDLIVDDAVIVEAKSVAQLLPVHEAQLLTYLRVSSKRVGLLVNFNARTVRAGLRRLAL